MESDTNTKKAEPAESTPQRSSFEKLMDLYWGGTERRISALTIRIIGINALSLVVLMLGIINLGRYETQILDAKIESFQKETIIIARTIAEASDDRNNLLQNLKNVTGYEISIYAADGSQIAGTLSPSAKITEYFNVKHQTRKINLSDIAKLAAKILPRQKTLPTYPAEKPYPPEIIMALKGKLNIAAWNIGGEKKDIILTGTAPLTKNGKITGAIHIIRSGEDIVADVTNFWVQMSQIFFLTMLATIFISIYLSGTIAQPLRRLSRAAETIRRTRSSSDSIPDLSNRLDEIGELSLVMRDMTETLRNRLGAIENFAADVAHELKNPLTSLKSATETLRISKKEKDKEVLLDLLQNDIERMDRLITDISATSRLDAELSRQSLEPINLTEILKDTKERYQRHIGDKITIRLDLDHLPPLWIIGLQGRIIQVFDNLISNALSFSKAGDTITISAHVTVKNIEIHIDDEGPGIPENKIRTIFERFYSERPDHEDYGKHSGLGLSICQQIMEALGGNIKASNRKNKTGARFTVTFNRA
jgi:two-component system sensor histidine kinase ChvG